MRVERAYVGVRALFFHVDSLHGKAFSLRMLKVIEHSEHLRGALWRVKCALINHLEMKAESGRLPTSEGTGPLGKAVLPESRAVAVSSCSYWGFCGVGPSESVVFELSWHIVS